jgi:hypothetical protein
LEKVSLKGKFKNYGMDFVIGDYHISQGKGIALSINKQDDLGIDTTLRGINTNFKYKPLKFNVFAGLVNNTNIDNTNNEIYGDKDDFIAGSSIEMEILKKTFILSANYNFIRFKEQSFTDENPKPQGYEAHKLHVFGGNLQYNFSDNIKFYFEYDKIIDDFYLENAKKDNPYAIYASFYWALKRLVLTQEFKRYKDFQIGFKTDVYNSSWNYALDSIFYNSPPTLERQGEKIKDIAGDIWGIRTNLKYKLTDNLKPYLNYLYSMSYSHKDRRAHHFYIGSEYYFNNLKSKIDLSLSVRFENDEIYDEASKSDDTDNYYGFEFDSGFYINSFISFDLKGHYHKMEKSIINENRTDNFDDFELQATIILFKNLFLSYLYNKYNFTQEVGDKHDYNAFDLKYKFMGENYLKLFYGSIRGGIKCVGGVCKDYPEFNGIKVEVLLAF